ncbi:hypothetical protein ABW21_db0202580 [Orbilia brochopaga]|nr:hypothetical protein ABW21_db0202580 [Drechslerella brochopaga]
MDDPGPSNSPRWSAQSAPGDDDAHQTPKSQPTPKSQSGQKSPRSPRRPPILKHPAIDPDSLLRLLKSHQYSDVTASVGRGPEMRIYQLHRNIICTRSRYFESACQYHVQSGSTVAQVQLPDMLPPVFDIVLEFIYGNILVLEAHQHLILALYRAAEFLQINSFKIQIARQLSKLLKHNRKNGTPIDFDGFEVVRGMFEHTSVAGHFTNLRKCTDELALRGNIPSNLIQAELMSGRSSDSTTKFWMALAISYQKALHATVCSECRGIVSTRMALDRMCCHCEDDGSDASATKEPAGKNVKFAD